MVDTLERDSFIKQRAAQALAKAGITEPPTDLYGVADLYGIIVRQGSLPPGVAGEYDRVSNTITLGAFDRWPLAHELGHALLSHGDQRCYEKAATSDVPLDEMDMGVPFEGEANRFARYLLVPRIWLAAEWKEEATPPEIARKLGVSERVIWLAALGYRLV